ncbi:MAG: hypothetical protein ABIQ55_09075, partial [Gemmatimonadaceae bacterium]
RVLAMVLTQDAPPLIDVRPDVPRVLSDIVMSCLSKDPETRPPTARAVLAALDGFSAGSGETRTQDRRAVPRVQFSIPQFSTPVKATPVKTPPVKTPPVTSTPVTSTPVINTPVFNNPVPSALGSAFPPGMRSAPVSSTPVTSAPVSSTPAEEHFAVAGEPTPADQDEAVGYDPPKKKSKKMLVGGVLLGIAAMAAAIFVVTSPGGSSDGAAPPNAPRAVADSAAVQSLPGSMADLPAAPESVAAPLRLDSQAIADSVKKAAATKKAAVKADSLKKVADSLKKIAAKADSLKQAVNTNRGKARAAAVAVWADASARKTLVDGATHMGGVLGKKRMGDLQTQINVLQPFLARAGLTYDQFKVVVGEAGINMFDEFGRIVPDSLRQFAGLSASR